MALVMLTHMIGTLKRGYTTIDCVGERAASETASRVQQTYVSGAMNALPALAAKAVERELQQAGGRGKVVCFCPTANQAQFVSELFTAMGVENGALHSRKSQAYAATARASTSSERCC